MTLILAVLAVAALVIARGASARVRELRDRLDRMEDQLAGRAVVARPAAPEASGRKSLEK
jgi:membrane protein implicated in regulation of membrane protease activity